MFTDAASLSDFFALLLQSKPATEEPPWYKGATIIVIGKKDININNITININNININYKINNFMHHVLSGPSEMMMMNVVP